jgi:hypothetical protein
MSRVKDDVIELGTDKRSIAFRMQETGRFSALMIVCAGHLSSDSRDQH